jgi:hypothetical protein
MIYHRMGDFFGSVADFTRCVELEPTNKQGSQLLANHDHSYLSDSITIVMVAGY